MANDLFYENAKMNLDLSGKGVITEVIFPFSSTFFILSNPPKENTRLKVSPKLPVSLSVPSVFFSHAEFFGLRSIHGKMQGYAQRTYLALRFTQLQVLNVHLFHSSVREMPHHGVSPSR